MRLDYSSLLAAFELFSLGLRKYDENRSDLFVRDACIQRFEYTYELAVKMIKRRLELDSAVPVEIDEMNFKDRIRLAGEKGLLTDPNLWFQFREMRNITSHNYDLAKSEQIVQIFPDFEREISVLITEFKSRSDA